MSSILIASNADVDVGYKFEEVPGPAGGKEEEVGGVEENHELDLTGIEIDHDALHVVSPLPSNGSADFEEDDKKEEMNDDYYHHAAGRGSKFEYAVEDVTSYDKY